MLAFPNPPDFQNPFSQHLDLHTKSHNVYDVWEMPSTRLVTTVHLDRNVHISRLLDEFRLLGPNWDEDDALPPATKALDATERLISWLNANHVSAYHAAPGPQGEIMVNFRGKEGRELEILFYPNRFSFVKASRETPPEQGVFEWAMLKKLTTWLSGDA
jgi:hypothetical protein